MTNPSVNRYLQDKAMDHIDHALGRPFDPLAETYRNYYAIDLKATLFYCNPHWKLGGVSRSRMAYWHVTDAGRAALAEHLRQIKSPHRRYEIEYAGISSTVIATTPGKARYSLWQKISDCDCDLTFMDFARASNVKVTI